MNKICFILFNFFIIGNVVAQNVSLATHNVSLLESNLSPAVAAPEPQTADDWFAAAERNERSGRLNEALTQFGKAAFAYHTDKKLSRYAASLLKMSNLHLMLNAYAEAEQVALNVALKVYARIGSKVGQMATYSQLAKIYFAANKLPQSMWFYSQQGIMAQVLNNKASYIDSVLGIAAIKIKKKQFYLAIKDLNKAELLAKNSKLSQFAQQIKNSRLVIADKK